MGIRKEGTTASMNDFIDRTFGDLDAYYPGSKRKLKSKVKAATTHVQKHESWEDEFYEKTLPNGRQIKMYTLGSLAKALNRPTKTVRFWVENGQLPTSPYRLPSTTGKNGKEYAGRRLYSKAMVEATVRIFAEARLLESDRVDWAKHRGLVDKVAEAWDTIRAEEMQVNN